MFSEKKKTRERRKLKLKILGMIKITKSSKKSIRENLKYVKSKKAT